MIYSDLHFALHFLFNIPARSLSSRAFACGTEGCGFDPQPRHTKRRKKIVSVARLLTLSVERCVLGNMAGSARCQLIM